MFFPLTSLVAEHRELGLVVAVALGFGFGFVLERAGFGRSTKLAAQFYFYDMTVFKVMFGAIVTTMVGLAVFSGLGLADLKAIQESGASETFVWPMLVGGLLLGAGFIVSGYCPGTSLVAASSGNIDGMVAFGGVMVGTLVFDWIFPWVHDFHMSGALGQVFLHDLLGIPQAVLAAGVTVMALSLFLGADKVEAKLARKRPAAVDAEATAATPNVRDPLRPRRVIFAILLGFAVLGLGTLALPGTPPASPSRARVAWIAAPTLAQRLLDQPWQVRVLDLRDAKACEEQRVPGSECTPLATLDKLGLAAAPADRELVLVAGDALKKAPAAARAFPGRVWLLQGGFPAWKAFALDKPPAAPDASDAKALNAWKFQVAVNSAVTGAKPAPPPAASGSPTGAAPKKKKKGGCS